MAKQCGTGKIYRDGYCKAKPGKASTDIGSICNENIRGDKRTKKSCTSNRFDDYCTWVPGSCAEDIGERGETPAKKEVLPKKVTGRKLTGFMPGGRMPFNETLDNIERKCRFAGNKMQKKGIPKKTATGKVVFAYNFNERLEKSDAAGWDKQRKACIEGINAAYSR